MSHQDQSGRPVYLTISLPQNNLKPVFPPGFRKKGCVTQRQHNLIKN